MKNISVEEILYRDDFLLPSKNDKNKKKTKALTLRVEKWWLKKLNQIAHKLSLDLNFTVGVQDLIREATRRTFIEEDVRSILKREGVMSETGKFNLLKTTLLSNNSPTT